MSQAPAVTMMRSNSRPSPAPSAPSPVRTSTSAGSPGVALRHHRAAGRVRLLEGNLGHEQVPGHGNEGPEHRLAPRAGGRTDRPYQRLVQPFGGGGTGHDPMIVHGVLSRDSLEFTVEDRAGARSGLR